MSLLQPTEEGEVSDTNVEIFTWILVGMSFLVLIEITITISIKLYMSKKYAGKNVLKGRYDLGNGQTGNFKFIVINDFPYDDFSPALKDVVEHAETQMDDKLNIYRQRHKKEPDDIPIAKIMSEDELNEQ